MLRRELLRLLASAPLLGRLRSLGAFTQAAAAEAPDAAVVYRRAFAWAERVPPGDWAKAREALESSRLGTEVDRWIDQARPALAALREAARIDACRWGDEAMPPEIIDRDRFRISNRHLTRLACLAARRHAEAGRFEEALDDAFAALSFARRTGADAPMIGRLFECADEMATLQTLGGLLPLLDRAALDSLARRLDALPPVAPASAMIGPESRFILNAIRAGLAKAGPILVEEDWERTGCDDDEVEALKVLTGGHRDRLLVHLDATTPGFAELGRRLDLPRPELDAAIEEFARTRRGTDPIPVGLVASARSFCDAVDRAVLNRALLRAGLVLVRDGEAAFRALRDPFGDGPFGLEGRKGGWIVRSSFPGIKSPTTEFRVGDPS
ncbi:hypothetical protein [Paludisphaera soli]|uniref:hypothetical protein n=1 Tax=Paludisphaera soli TaxID=2712865 RepID=UPI0013EDBFE2|nr:hypothetical protein [Paludisphaera soli]